MRSVNTRLSKIEFNMLKDKAEALEKSIYEVIRIAIQSLLKMKDLTTENKELTIIQLQQEKAAIEETLQRVKKQYEEEIKQKEQLLKSQTQIYNIQDETNKEILKEIFKYALYFDRDPTREKHLKDNARSYALNFIHP